MQQTSLKLKADFKKSRFDFQRHHIVFIFFFLVLGCQPKEHREAQPNQYSQSIFDKKNDSLYDFENAFLLALYMDDESLLDFADASLHQKINNWTVETKFDRCPEMQGGFSRSGARDPYLNVVSFQCGYDRLTVEGLVSKKIDSSYMVIEIKKIRLEGANT